MNEPPEPLDPPYPRPFPHIENARESFEHAKSRSDTPNEKNIDKPLNITTNDADIATKDELDSLEKRQPEIPEHDFNMPFRNPKARRRAAERQRIDVLKQQLENARENAYRNFEQARSGIIPDNDQSRER